MVSLFIISTATYVALPSLRNTQLKVSSISAAVIFFDTGFSARVNDCCVDSILAYRRMLILAVARIRFLPI